MQEKRVIKIAFGVSLLLHLVLGAATWRIPLRPTIDPAMAAPDAQDVEIFLVDDEDLAQNDPEQPQAFTSMPERLASEVPPEDPDYLSNQHSLAADNKLGDETQPSADEEWIADQVDIRKDEDSGSEGAEYAQQPMPETEQGVTPTEEGAAGSQEEKTVGEPLDEIGEWFIPAENAESGGETQGEGEDEQTEEKPDLEDWWGGEAPSVLKEGKTGEAGDEGFDFNQAARGKVRSGMAFQENFSLNTWQWNYGPWMQWFINELHRHWMAPYAYRIGVISGYTVVKIVIEKDGRVSMMNVEETEGHDSLHDASTSALKAFQPYRKLPAEFPEENLVITLGLHYPAWRR